MPGLTGSCRDPPQCGMIPQSPKSRLVSVFFAVGIGCRGCLVTSPVIQHLGNMKNRPDVAAVGGRVLSGKTGKIIGGRMTVEGKVFYEGLRQGFGGYLHRAELSQDAQALDLRCIRIQPSCREVFENIVGVPYTEIRRRPEEQPVFDVTVLPAGVDIRTLSLRLSEALRQQGRLLYLPEYPGECKTLSMISTSYSGASSCLSHREVMHPGRYFIPL